MSCHWVRFALSAFCPQTPPQAGDSSAFIVCYADFDARCSLLILLRLTMLHPSVMVYRSIHQSLLPHRRDFGLLRRTQHCHHHLIHQVCHAIRLPTASGQDRRYLWASGGVQPLFVPLRSRLHHCSLGQLHRRLLRGLFDLYPRWVSSSHLTSTDLADPEFTHAGITGLFLLQVGGLHAVS